MSNGIHSRLSWVRRLKLSLFEKVILVNSIILVGEALAGLWVTSHNLEVHHYLIDTSFLVLATLLSLGVNIVLLRASFRPLFSLLATIRSISGGKTALRAHVTADSEIGELAQAFNTMLDRLESARREQSLLILQAHEEERRRVARELHDETSQDLTALLVHAEILSQSLQMLPDDRLVGDARTQLVEGLQRLVTLTQTTLESTRVLAQQLRPSVLDDLGLVAALHWLGEDSQQRLHLIVALHIDEQLSSCVALPSVYEIELFRIAQESLTNVARHAQAHHVTLSLCHEQRQIVLTIADDGCGFDTELMQKGLGIRGMRERAALPGGMLTIQSQPGQGTTVRAILPLPMVMNEERAHGK